MKVLRQETLDGRKVYLVEQVHERELPADFVPKEIASKYPGKVGLLDVARAWVDPRRGFLPVRYELGMAHTYEGKRLGSEGLNYHLVLTVSDFRQFPNGGWYPVDGKVESFMQDPAATKRGVAANDLNKILAGTAERPPLVAYSTTTWKVLNIEADEDLAGAFTLEFPTNTEYFEGRTRMARFIGNIQDYLENTQSGGPVATSLQPPAAVAWGRRQSSILIALNLAALAAVVGVILYRRRKLVSGVQQP